MLKKNIAVIILLLLLPCSFLASNIYFSNNGFAGEREGESSESFKNGKEIERKWLVNLEDIPYDLSKADIFEIEQSYINFDPEIRIRKITCSETGTFYMLAVKSDISGNGLVRSEMEFYITEENYYKLLTKKEYNTIYKTRYQIPVDNVVRAIDIFKGDLSGLVYLEIEYESEEQAAMQESPGWVIKEVTNDRRYKNQSLARYGIP